METKKRVRPVKQFPLDRDLIRGLEAWSRRDREPQAILLRRVLREALKREGFLK
jgi:hypothetical protein